MSSRQMSSRRVNLIVVYVHIFENGIAMGNAAKDIKKKAKYIIDCNNTDSIYNFLIKKGFINE